MTGISQEVGNFSEQVWGVSMSVVNVLARTLATNPSPFRRRDSRYVPRGVRRGKPYGLAKKRLRVI